MKPTQISLVALIATLVFNSFAQSTQRLARVVQKSSAPAAVATSAAPAETLRYAGLVVDAAGQPVAGAQVEFYQPKRSRPTGSADLKPLQTVTTGTNGQFEFQGARSNTVLFARKAGLAPAWIQIWNPTKDMTAERLVVTAPTNLAGIVVDDTDRPVANAEVWVSFACIEQERESGGTYPNYMNSQALRRYFSTRTAADGRFRIEGFPASASADLAVCAPGKVLRAVERDSISFDTLRCFPGQQDIKLVLDPGGTVEGKVRVETTGQPLAGTRLSLEAKRSGRFSIDTGPESVQSDAEGRFHFTSVAPGSYILHAAFGTNAVPDWVAETLPLVVEAGRTTRDLEVFAVHGGFLEVAVREKKDHRPSAHVRLSVYKKAYRTGTESDNNGLALVRLPSGEYQVAAYREDARPQTSSATIEAGKTNHLEIELKPPPRLAGIVREPSGVPAPGLTASLCAGFGPQSTAETDAQGRFELKWNPNYGGQNRPCCVVVRDVARNLAAAHTIEDAGEEAPALDLRLAPGRVVTGRVEDPNGKPLTNATTQLFIWLGNTGTQFKQENDRADAQGRFEIPALPAECRFSLSVRAAGYGSANQNIEADSETNRIELEPFVLRPADRQLAGQVLDSDDKPVARVRVYIYGKGQPNASAHTDEQGHFKFDHVCEGTVRVSASARSTHGNTRAEAGETNVVVKLGVAQSYSFRRAPKRPSLKGKPLPDLAPLGLPADCAPAGKPVLIGLFDLEQRPSRHFIHLLAGQHGALSRKGLVVLGLQATVVTAESFKEWKEASPLPFPVGRVAEKSDKTKWACEVESLPRLILTDAKHRVVAEGFALEELDTQLKAIHN